MAPWVGVRNQESATAESPQFLTPDSSRIDIESTLRLPSSPPCRNVLPKEGARAVLGIAMALLQHFEDRDAGVQPDQVGQRQRPHRMIHAELHHGIDGLGAADTFHEAVHSLVD